LQLFQQWAGNGMTTVFTWFQILPDCAGRGEQVCITALESDNVHMKALAALEHVAEARKAFFVQRGSQVCRISTQSLSALS